MTFDPTLQLAINGVVNALIVWGVLKLAAMSDALVEKMPQIIPLGAPFIGILVGLIQKWLIGHNWPELDFGPLIALFAATGAAAMAPAQVVVQQKRVNAVNRQARLTLGVTPRLSRDGGPV